MYVIVPGVFWVVCVLYCRVLWRTVEQSDAPKQPAARAAA